MPWLGSTACLEAVEMRRYWMLEMIPDWLRHIIVWNISGIDLHCSSIDRALSAISIVTEQQDHIDSFTTYSFVEVNGRVHPGFGTICEMGMRRPSHRLYKAGVSRMYLEHSKRNLELANAVST